MRKEGTYDHLLVSQADPITVSARDQRDTDQRPEIKRVRVANCQVYAVRRAWHQFLREGFELARSTVERFPPGIFPLETPCRAADEADRHPW
jgi:hypothetical protein